MRKTILSVRHLHVVLGGEEIIRDLTFEVKERETLIILGPNGAGKSTLLRTLLGLIPCSGEVTWATRSISYLPPQELFQRRDLPPLTIEDFSRSCMESTEETRRPPLLPFLPALSPVRLRF